MNPRIGYFAAALAKMSAAEQSLEPHIAALGVRYRCQHGFFNYEYRADFALLDYKLAVEVDDDSHNTPAKKAADAIRTAKIEASGWKVIRMPNAAALGSPRLSLYKLLRSAGPKDSPLWELASRLYGSLSPSERLSLGRGQSPTPTDPDAASAPPGNSAAPKSRKA